MRSSAIASGWRPLARRAAKAAASASDLTHANAVRPQPVFVEEPDIPTTVSILRGIKSKYESHHGVTITDGALVLAAKLAKRYIPSRRLPDSAIDLLDESAGAKAPRSRVA